MREVLIVTGKTEVAEVAEVAFVFKMSNFGLEDANDTRNAERQGCNKMAEALLIVKSPDLV